MIWDNLREEEFEGAIEKSGGLCVIPIGCVEKHGQHLPVGTDYIEAMTITKAAAEIEDVVIFPIGAWLGEVSCFHAFKDPGAVKLRGCIGIKQSFNKFSLPKGSGKNLHQFVFVCCGHIHLLF